MLNPTEQKREKTHQNNKKQLTITTEDFVLKSHADLEDNSFLFSGLWIT